MTSKLCVGCNVIKPLETGYYRAGSVSYQKLCKPCHNAKRTTDRRVKRATNPTVYKKRGFAKLDASIQTKIKNDLKKNIPKKQVAQKYGIKYATLCLWVRKGL